MLRSPSLYAVLAALLVVIGLGWYGQAQRHRAARAEAALAGCRGTVATREAELAGAQADAAALRDRVALQNAAVDAMAAAGDRLVADVRRARADADRQRAETRARVDSVLVAPAPATCEGAVGLLRTYVPNLSTSW